jgi:hypothetical protein
MANMGRVVGLLFVIVSAGFCAISKDSLSDVALIDKYGSMSKSLLMSNLASKQGFERTLTLLFLTSSDTGSSSYTSQAYWAADSSYNENKNAYRLAMLGMAASLMARDAGDDLKATRYVGQAISHLTKAVDMDKNSNNIRIIRIFSYVEIPELFKVNRYLKEDADFIKKQIKNGLQPDISTKSALAAIAFRFGNLSEAKRYWKEIVQNTPSDHPEIFNAKRNLEKINGK